MAYLAFFLIDLRQDYAQLLTPCSGIECNFLAISPAEVAVLKSWGLSTRFYAMVITGTAGFTVAVYWLLSGSILWRQARTRIGLGVSVTLLVLPVSAISGSADLTTSYPGLQIPAFFLSLLGGTIFFLFLYLFPNGRFVPRWAPVPLIGTMLVIITAILDYEDTISLAPAVARINLATLFFGIFLVLGLQVYRYRRVSSPIERQQTKWALIGLIIVMSSFPVWVFFFGGSVAFPPGEGRLLASLGGWGATALLMIALPITVTIAIQRYRLWDIDVIIRRTLIYSALTAVLAVVYFGTVILLQRFLPAQTQLTTVLSTLAIAALFNPLRHRIQDLIDRRFYRHKYDSEQTLAAFSTRTRDEVNLEQLSQALLEVVDETLQPAEAQIWLREARGGALENHRGRPSA